MSSLSVLTYNCHLFGSVSGQFDGLGWKDTQRREAITNWLNNSQTPQYDILAFEEVWSTDGVKHFRDQLKSRYPSHFDDPKGAPLSNQSGLILFSGSRVVMDPKSMVYVDMISQVGGANFSAQDAVTGKGYFSVNALVDGTQNVTIIGTHMPTSANTSRTHRDALAQCFQILADACSNAPYPVILLGDFNIDPSKLDSFSQTGQTFYQEWIGSGGLLGQAGMTDWFQTNLSSQPSGYQQYSVDGANNACWQHFNRSKAESGEYDTLRIDYVMTTSQFSVTSANIAVSGPNLSAAMTAGAGAPSDSQSPTWSVRSGGMWYWEDHGKEPRDCSDHFPVAATLTY
jgi:exonuclease III